MKMNNRSSLIVINADLSPDWQGQRSNFLQEARGEESFLEYLLSRLRRFGLGKEEIFLYVPDKDENKAIYSLAQKPGLNLIKQGEDGLKQIISIMEEKGKKHLVRIKAGSVFIDKKTIWEIIRTLEEQEGCEYLSLSGLPMGIEADGFSLSGVRKLLSYSKDSSFDIGSFREKFISSCLTKDLGLGLNLSLNRPEDVRFARYIIGCLDDDEWTLNDVIKCLYGQREMLALRQKGSKDLEDTKYYSKKLNMIETNRQRIKLNSYPCLLQIEASTRCNLRCRMCQRESSIFDEPQKDMSMDTFSKIVPVFPYICQSSIFGIGEPLLNRNFNKMFTSLRENLVDVLFYTNGMLITEKMSKVWVERGLRDIIFSLDGTSAAKVEDLRKGLSFEKVLDKIRMINRYKELYHKRLPNIRVSYTAMKSNIKELPDMVRLSKELGAGKIIVTFMVAFIEEFRQESLYYHQELTNKVFKEAILLGKKLGVDVQVPGFFSLSKEKGAAQRGPCLEPWTSSYIFHDGKVRPCCFTDQIMGDLKKQSFEEIWNGEPYQRLRKTVNTKNPPFECSRCHFVKYQAVDNKKTHIKIPGLISEE